MKTEAANVGVNKLIEYGSGKRKQIKNDGGKTRSAAEKPNADKIKNVSRKANTIQQYKGASKQKSKHTQGPSKRRGASRNRVENNDVKDRREQKLAQALAKDKKDYFNTKRDEEYKIMYNDSEEDEPSWDTRVTAVKKRQAQLRLKKRMDNHILDLQEARTNRYLHDYDTDSDREQDARESHRPRAAAAQQSQKEAPPKHKGKGRDDNKIGERGGDYSENDLQTKDTDDSAMKDENEDEPFSEDGHNVRWKAGARRETEHTDSKENGHTMQFKLQIPTRYSKATKYIDISDEDSWFWDWKGSASKKGITIGKDQTDLSQLDIKTRRLGPQMSVHDELHYRIESDKLKEYKRAHYESLRHHTESSESSSRNSILISSSSSSLASQTSKTREEIYQLEERARRKAAAYRFLDDSSDEADRNSRQRGSARRKIDRKEGVKTISEANISRGLDNKHHWDMSDDTKDSSMTSKSTSSSDTERSSSSRQESQP